MAAALLSSAGAAAAAPTDISGPSTARVAVFRLAPDPAEVRRVQALLFDLGLYDGPLDGELSPATERAVVAFQHLAGRAPDGWIDDTLLARLSDAAARADPHRRLERARIEDWNRSRRLLESLGLTRAHFASVDVPADPDRATCRPVPLLRCLLADARSSANAIARDDVRDGALGTIADVQIGAGLDADALSTIARIEDPRLMLAALRRMARARADVDRGPAAIPLARLLHEAPPQPEPPADMSGVAAIDEARRRALAHVELVDAHRARPADAGAILVKAIDAAHAIRRPYARDYALYRIGVAALALSDDGRNGAAMADGVALQIDHRQLRSALLWHIAAERRRRDGPTAAETAEVAALAMTASVTGTLSRAWLLADAAELYVARGHVAVASDILRLAVVEGAAITDAAGRAQAFARLAAARATLDRAAHIGR